MKVYTDGACCFNPGPGGWAAVFEKDTENIDIISGGEYYSTNNRMELTSVIKAIERAKEVGISKIEIYSDSSYVVNGVNLEWVYKWQNRGWVNNKGEPVKNKDLWKKLCSLLVEDEVEVKFVKVKGHFGDPLNELADKTARSEAKNRQDE